MSTDKNEPHLSVMKQEIIEGLDLQAKGIYVDLTLGAGGHATEIWKVVKDEGKLIVFDVETRALTNFAAQLELTADLEGEITKLNNLTLCQKNFDTLDSTLKKLKLDYVDGIIADLGWSSEQLQSIPGLSYEQEQELDMRLDPNLGVKAKDLVNALGKKELKQLFMENADFSHKEAQLLMNAIISQRQNKPLETTTDLNKVIDLALPVAKQAKAGNTRARVYQALRIAVNSELSSLQFMLEQALAWLRPSIGTLQVITFHSGEEKIVENNFDNWVDTGKATYLYKEKYQQPSVAELKQNLKSRSAKLWGIKAN